MIHQHINAEVTKKHNRIVYFTPNNLSIKFNYKRCARAHTVYKECGVIVFNQSNYIPNPNEDIFGVVALNRR